MNLPESDQDSPVTFVDLLTAPPLPDVGCACTPEVCGCADIDACACPVSHWHQRHMAAMCDRCCLEQIEADVFAYDRPGARVEIARIARENGWRVIAGRYTCPDCLARPAP